MIKSVALVRRLAYHSGMFRRFLLLLLIALLPLQGIAASFMTKCEGMSAGPVTQIGEMPCHEMDALDHGMPCHDRSDDGALAGSQLDQGCCHHLAVAIPQVFAVPGATLVRGQSYPAIASSFTDHLPDRLQRPPLSLVV